LRWLCALSQRQVASACGMGRSTVGEYLERAERAERAGVGDWSSVEALGDGPPLLDPTLQRPKLALLVAARISRHQVLEQRLRLQLRSRLQALHDPRPVLGERVLPRPPAPRLPQLRRKLPLRHVPTRRVAVHPGAKRRKTQQSCLLISSINFLTCASVTTNPGSPCSKVSPDCGRRRRLETTAGRYSGAQE
jgi:hypothetical protein